MWDWKSEVDAFAKTSGFEAIVVDQGRGIVFGDGFDTCWILEDDVLSTLPAPASEVELGRTLQQFERINSVRRDVIHVLRHYLSSKRIGVTRSATGNWGVQLEGGLSSSLCVGAFLTALARDRNDVAGCLAGVLKGSVIRHPPSAKRIARYLGTPGDPPDERGFDDSEISIGTDSIAGILKWMNLCRAAEAIPEAATEADGKRFASRIEHLEATGPIGQALLRVGERLPDVKPSFELLESAIVLEFPDGLDSIQISPKSRKFARQVRDEDPTVVGDRVADDFERLGRLRRVTLRAIDQAAAKLGWTVDEAWAGGLLNGSKVWRVGRDTREITIDVGNGLTGALREQSPEQFVRSVGGSADFVAACLDGLRSVEATSVDLALKASRGRLPPRPRDDAPTLIDLSDARIAQTDEWAGQTLASFKRSEDIWRHIKDRKHFDPAIDTWLTPGEVIELASSVPEDSWAFSQALRIRLEAGIAGTEEKARELVGRLEGLYEVSDDLIAMCWRFRNEFPKLAAENFAPQQFDDVPHAEARAGAGDPIAKRYVELGTGESEDERADLEDLPVAAHGLDPRARASAWARWEWRWSIGQSEMFDRAITEGWTEVADALDDNPHLATVLLTHEARGTDGFDAPGILMAGELLLAWSRLKPTNLLARLILTARDTDIVARAQEAEREAGRRNPKIDARTVALAVDVMQSWWDQAQVPMAIAWTRWRNAGRV